jgi:hypothetical protein
MANNVPASMDMREMLDLAKGLAHDGTVEGTMKALELVTNMIRYIPMLDWKGCT